MIPEQVRGSRVGGQHFRIVLCDECRNVGLNKTEEK